MMKQFKDRYTQALLLGLFGVIFTIYFLNKTDDNKNPVFGAYIVALSAIYLAHIFQQSGRIHLTEDQKEDQKEDLKQGKIKLKGENGCGFDENYLKTNKIDGVSIDGIRYKTPNGTDVYIEEGKIKPLGVGSHLVIKLRKAGLEPNSIQNDACW